MNFSNAYILGVQRRSDYFGERTANYRTVDTISVEGYIDLRASNTDYKGVRQAISVIDSYVTSASTEDVLDSIVINGTGFGTGKIISLDFPASTSVDEDQIRIGKYTADIEIYHSGNLRDSLENVSVPYPQFLDSFSEDFNITLGKDNTYTLDHSLDIAYLSGKAGGVSIDPISGAKTLAKNLFAQSPTQFSTVIPDSYGSINAASREYFNETYNIVDGSTTFSKKISLLPSGSGMNYSLKLSNNFEFDQLGIAKVSENGEIQPRTTEYLEEALEGLNIEIANSYGRCNTVYNSYQNYLNTGVGDNNTYTLYSKPITLNKNINNSAGTSNYAVTYTDDLGYATMEAEGLGFTTTERTIDMSKDAMGVSTLTEQGSITSAHSKGVTFNPYSLIPQRSDVFQRCKNFYDDNMPPLNSFSLRNVDSKFTVPIYGKQVSYTYSFKDDPTLYTEAEDSIFSRKKISNSDKIGVPNQSLITFPNADQVLHTADQTSLGTRSTKFEGQLRRRKYTSNIQSPQISPDAIDSAKTDCLQEAYNVFVTNPKIRSLDKGQIYVGNASYSFDSSNSFSMNVDSTFTMERIDGNAELNLSFGNNIAADTQFLTLAGVLINVAGSGYSTPPIVTVQGNGTVVSGSTSLNAQGGVTSVSLFTAGIDVSSYSTIPTVNFINLGAGVTLPASGSAIMTS